MVRLTLSRPIDNTLAAIFYQKAILDGRGFKPIFFGNLLVSCYAAKLYNRRFSLTLWCGHLAR